MSPRAGRQETDNVRYGDGTDESRWMTYSYNLAGALIEQQYPSGRVVRNTLDANGDLMAVLGSKATHPQFWAYATGFKYNAAGAVTSLQLGNGNWESTVFNSRLQPTQIALGTTVNATNLLDLDYEYGVLNTGNGLTDATKNNGNLSKQMITVPSVAATPGFVATQYYAYDSLNRIEIATENVLPNGATDPEFGWRQHFKFDRYGNRNFVTTGATATTTLGTCPTEICNPAISPSNNQITSTGYTFDASGNTTRDAENRKFTYDAENKQTKVETLSGQTVTGTVGEYFYDGDGRRIKKRAFTNNVLTEETTFVYDAAAKLIGEYSNEVASAQDAKVAYLTNDHLGSPRINTNSTGGVTSRHDYHPFGEEIVTSARASGLAYSGDTVRKQFTGYERDKETEFDFAQARYYANGLGRLNSPDPENYGATEDDPQSWNGYVYSRNNPILLTDPDGLEYVICEPGNKNCRTYSDADVMNMKGDTSVGTFVGSFNEAGLYGGMIIDPVSGQQTGTVVQTSIDSDTRRMLVGGRPIAEGAQTPLTIMATIMSFFTGGVGGGAAKYGVTPAATRAAAPAAASASTQVAVQVSKGNLQHIAKHLDEFQKLDPSMTLENVVELGQNIAARAMNSSPRLSNATFTEVVRIGGQSVNVKVVLNSQGGLRSVYVLP